MRERITSIKEYDADDYAMSGFTITTDESIITLEMYDQSQCCEQWGYLLTEDDTEQFVGAMLLEINVVDVDRRKTKVPDITEAETLFVDLVTSEGVLQFVAYNIHNGYYGHTVKITVRKTLLDTVL